MATMILGAAGTALAGPLGGAIGAFSGRQVDRSFGAGSTPRITDLRTPSARYGDPIPAVWGKMRVAGVILWSSEPVVSATVSKAGSGQSTSVSFALALSSGPVSTIGRIWADGRLIRDASGHQTTAFG